MNSRINMEKIVLLLVGISVLSFGIAGFIINRNSGSWFDIQSDYQQEIKQTKLAKIENIKEMIPLRKVRYYLS